MQRIEPIESPTCRRRHEYSTFGPLAERRSGSNHHDCRPTPAPRSIIGRRGTSPTDHGSRSGRSHEGLRKTFYLDVLMRASVSVALLSLVLASTANAQMRSGGVSGIIKDSLGLPI